MTIKKALETLRPHLPTSPAPDLALASTATPDEPRCARCGLLPEDNPAYLAEAADELDLDLAETEPADVVELARGHARSDGTYSRATGAFLCTGCYIAAGMPVGKAQRPCPAV